MKPYTLLLGIGMYVMSAYLISCVPSRQYEEVKMKQKQCEDENERLKGDNQNLTTKVTELSESVEELGKSVKKLQEDTSATGVSFRRISTLYNELTKSYDKLLANKEKLLAGNSEETRKIIAQLQSTQEDLQRKEDDLKKLSRDLSVKEQNLNDLNSKLQQREARLMELESILKRKDSTVVALKNTVSDALLGFKNNGLTVEQRNGKVYVSLEERLLFASGSIEVDKKGVEALKQLAKVLEKNQDINMVIEGHTDDVPIAGGVIKDNWDLSVLRATSIVKILTTNSTLNPKRITAAGRGEYLPVDPEKNKEARKKNRRTEIILTPKLDELLKVLETN